ncbi:hypothetical protein ASE14_02985 [Agromyces sp. Root81]|nr:hypothetical protein ASE14_02985 [Agromyces sp. Root81]
MVTTVATIANTEDAGRQRPNSLVIVPREVARSGDVALDLILRRAAAVRVSCLVVESGPDRIPLSTERLAVRFGIAIWREVELDPSELQSRVEQLVRDPELVGAGAIRLLSETLQQPAADLAVIVTRVSNALDVPVALVGADGRSVAGPALGGRTAIAERIALSERRGDLVDTSLDAGNGQRLLLAPAFPLVGDHPRFWLAALVARGLDSRLSHVFTALRIATFALSAHLAQTSLAFERENRDAGALLGDLLTRGDNITLGEVEQATARGWQLFGWHVAVQIRAESAVSALPRATIAHALDDGLHAHAFQMRPIGLDRTLAFWVTAGTSQDGAAIGQIAARLKAALNGVERTYPGLRLYAGIGGAREGVAGLGASLGEARHALAFAEAEHGSAVVQRSDAMTANRLVESWIPDGVTREVVTALIAPLRAADTSGQLVRTLRTYLDLESNTSETAELLHVHRNTVLQRLRRARELVPIDLDEPSGRLAVRLALRLDG